MVETDASGVMYIPRIMWFMLPISNESWHRCLSSISAIMAAVLMAADLPKQWLGRELNQIEQGFVYVSDPRTAEGAQQIVSRVSKRFTEATGREPGRGLVIVTGIGDEPIQTKCEADIRFSWLKRIPSPWGGVGCFLPGLHGIPLSREDLKSLGFEEQSAESITWAAAIPTKDSFEGTYENMFRTVFGRGTDKEGQGKEVPTHLKLLLKPLEHEAKHKLRALVETAVYAGLVDSCADLSATEKGELIMQYWRWSHTPSWVRERWPPKKGM